jgi:cytosine/adenosine deaminase-related metal-dependent hydrolase
LFCVTGLATAVIYNHAGSDFNQWITLLQALAMATRNGARAFSLDAGAIAVGKLADIVLLRRDSPAYRPLNDVVNQLEPSMQRELAAARSMEPTLAEMYFRVFGKQLR